MCRTTPAELKGLNVVEVHGAVRRQAREVHPRVCQSAQHVVRSGSSRGRRRRAAHGSPRPPEAVGKDAPHEAAVVLVLRVPLARVSGSSFQQPPASLGGGGAGMSASCCEGAVSRYAAVMPTTVQSDLGKRERSSAALNFVLMAAIMVPARADGDAGLTIHGASLRK